MGEGGLTGDAMGKMKEPLEVPLGIAAQARRAFLRVRLT